VGASPSWNPQGPSGPVMGLLYLFTTGKALVWSQSQVTLPRLLLLLIMIMIKFGESSKNNNFVVVMMKIIMK
jgi:hypothetical protein